MSDSFMVAARIQMSRAGFETWLATPVPGVAAIENPARMYDGWSWHGKETPGQWPAPERIGTPRDHVAQRIEQTCQGQPELTILRHRDGALEAYFFNLGYGTFDHALLILAAAKAFRSDEGEDLALYWAEAAGWLVEPDGSDCLAVLAIGAGRVRFVDSWDLSATVAALTPVQDSYFDLVEAIGADSQGWDWNSERQFFTAAPRDPRFVDPSVLG